MKIFVIEDDKTLKRELMELLNKYGYETYKDGAELLN